MTESKMNDMKKLLRERAENEALRHSRWVCVCVFYVRRDT